MYVTFDQLPKSSRVWVYQSDRELNQSEVSLLNNLSEAFCRRWAAHGADLVSSFKIYHDRFLVLAVDESAGLPSGCSIDSSVHLVRALEKELELNFFDRTKVAFFRNDQVCLEPMSSLKGKIQHGEILEETLTFNNLVSTIEELEDSWRVPAGESWLKRYFA